MSGVADAWLVELLAVFLYQRKIIDRLTAQTPGQIFKTAKLR